MPDALCLLFQIDVEVNMVFNLIVFRVRTFLDCLTSRASFALFIVTKIGSTKHPRLLKDPIGKLSAELHIIFILNHDFVSAYLR